MDSKKYADKVMDLHGFSLECYPVNKFYGYIFFDDGVDMFRLDPLFERPHENIVNNFIFSILDRFYEHFVSNLCVKKEDFWYVWDTVSYKLNQELLDKFYNYHIPKRDFDFYGQHREPDFYLPNSNEFFKILQYSYGSGPNHYINRGICSISYTQHDSQSNTIMFKELILPVPSHRRYSHIDRNISFHW